MAFRPVLRGPRLVQERAGVPAEVAGLRDVAPDRGPDRAHRPGRGGLALEGHADPERVRSEGDAVRREVLVERIAEAAFGSELHEGALGGDHRGLVGRHGCVSGKGRQRGQQQGNGRGGSQDSSFLAFWRSSRSSCFMSL